MTQEDKELLLRDLCARLPYKVKCFCKWAKEAPNGTVGCIQEISTFLLDELEIMDKPEYSCQISEIKPYLRPMSSMTEEEEKEFQKIKLTYHFDEDSYILLDWLNKKMFDYRGLIEKGLAIAAPEGMYKTE